MIKQKSVVIEKDNLFKEDILNLELSGGWRVVDKTILDDEIIYIMEKTE